MGQFEGQKHRVGNVAMALTVDGDFDFTREQIGELVADMRDGRRCRLPL